MRYTYGMKSILPSKELWEKFANEYGIWRDFGPTRLTFLEYLLIGVASATFVKDLLNEEGVNR